MGAASAHGQRVQFVGGSAFEITQEFFVASLVQRFKSPERTQGRLDAGKANVTALPAADYLFLSGSIVVFDEPSGADCIPGGVCPCGLEAGAPP
jgi:hypothetical protein